MHKSAIPTIPKNNNPSRNDECGKNNEFNLTLKIAKIYLSDSEDLIHKATGWMLREIGKRNEKVLLSFMNKNHKKMPRITVSYALERINKKKKQQYMIKSSRKIH